MKKIYVLDTSVLAVDANSIFSFENNDVIIPIKVLDEVDGLKKRQGPVGFNARTFIRSLDKLREKGSLLEGVSLGKGMGKLSVHSVNVEKLPVEWESDLADNMIICTGLTVRDSGVDPEKVILVTKDINVRVKCDAVGLLTEDYRKEKVIEDSTELYTGMKDVVVDPQMLDDLHNGLEVGLEGENLYPNQFVMLRSSADERRTALARYPGNDEPLLKIKEYKRKCNLVFGLTPRNREQEYALNLLLNPNIPVVSLIGRAGCGKTLLALAAGLEQIIESQEYGKLIVSRPVMPLGNDIGFLPGTLEDKMAPWLAPIRDNLEFLSQTNQDFAIEEFMGDGTVEIEALTYIRGRSIANAFIIIDEAQQLTQHELKTILTRVGTGTKIVLTGDIEQIDNLYVDETSNGLTYAVEKFKDHDMAGHVTLLRGERSKVATLAAKIL